MASLLRRGKYESGETDQGNPVINHGREAGREGGRERRGGGLTRLRAMIVVSRDPILTYFEGSVSSGLGMGYERKRSQG